jgi:hypothetical protein
MDSWSMGTVSVGWSWVGSACHLLYVHPCYLCSGTRFNNSLLTIGFVHQVTAAALGVLIASNHSRVDRWKVGRTTIQPQVWLSVLTTIMDGLMIFVLVDGGTVYFWRQALHGIKV